MIKFISYTGKYPNLCSGVLTVEIDGKEVRFGHEIRSYNLKQDNIFYFKKDNINGRY